MNGSEDNRRALCGVTQRVGLAALTACCLLPAAYSAADATHIDDENELNLTVIKMEVTPADEPVPAFKHRLVYDRHQRLPGNRPQWYARAYPEETYAHRVWLEATSRDDDAFNDYYVFGTPISAVDWDKFEKPRSAARSLMDTYLAPGAQRRDCDWGIDADRLVGPEAIAFLLPEFQGSRRFARMANAAVREAIAQRRYDDALRYLRTEYQLGRDVAEEPILVCCLIGVAMHGTANGGLTDLIAAPDSPNLYWALSELPSPPVSIGEAMNADLALPERVFPILEGAETTERTAAEWNAAWQRLVLQSQDGTINSDTRLSEGLLGQLVPTLFGLTGYSHAKERLVAWGHDPAEVEAMAVGRVLTIYTAKVIRIAADEHRKAHIADLSMSQSRRQGHAADQLLGKMRPLSDHPDREIVPIVSWLMPATHAVKTAEMRVARDIAALRVIEALRMHAARNEDRFPHTLEDVTCVPVPDNPATDKAFIYHLRGQTAVLELPDWEGFPGYSRRYEITIKR